MPYKMYETSCPPNKLYLVIGSIARVKYRLIVEIMRLY